MRSTTHQSKILRHVAIAAMSAAAAAVIAASAAQAACGTRGLGSTHSTRCSDSWPGNGSRQNNGISNDYNLGTVKGTQRRSGGSQYDFGNARRPNRWNRRTNLGRGTFRPK